ncbi:transketolase C-terminal domain-containing protein, partial [Chloroflexota bacterium]
YVPWLEHMEEKYRQMATELRYETYRADDADLILVTYGYVSRVSKEAVDMAREQGLKAGLLRLITLWPFPYEEIEGRADRGAKFLVVEDSLGQMVDDVRCAVSKAAEVHFLGMKDRHIPTDGGVMLPARILQEIRRLL